MIYIEKNTNYFPKLFLQKKLIEKAFGECFECQVTRENELQCIGYMQPISECRNFKLKLIYNYKSPPKIYVLDPTIEKRKHMYADGRLCLYYPKENPWQYHYNLTETIIPWTAHWIVYYETWNETNVWYGPESPHEGDK